MPDKQGNPNIFDYLNAINEKKQVEYDKKVAGAYILLLWLSHSKDLIHLTNKMNKYLFQFTDEQMFGMMYHNVPKKKRFIKWVKKEKMPKEKQDKVNELMKKYEMSEREAKLCLQN